MARKSRRNQTDKSGSQEIITGELDFGIISLKTAAYARLSSDEGGGESIETQIEMLYQFIESRPDLMLEDTYVDSGFTGTNFDRPAFKRLMDEAKIGKINCIVVKDLSRFGRNFLETGYYLETILPGLNVRLIAINDDFDSSRESDRNSIAVPIKNIVNEFYAKEASKKQTVAFAISKENGSRKIGGNTFGYQIDQKTNRLVPCQKTAFIVKLIFRWFRMGYTTCEIAKRLNMLEVGTPKYYKSLETGEQVQNLGSWTHDKVYDILRNQTYVGDRIYGKKRQSMYKAEKRHVTKRDEWTIHENTHEALVSRGEYEKVQSMLDAVGKRKKEQRLHMEKEREKIPDLFPQKVRCAECGCGMWFQRYSKNSTAGELNGAEYICKRKNGAGCRQKINMDYLKIVVMDQIRNLARVMSDKKKLLKQMNSGGEDTGIIMALQRKKADLTAELAHAVELGESLYENLIEGIIDKNEYGILKEHYILEVQKLKKEIEVVENERREVERKVNHCLEVVETLEEYLDTRELDKKMADEFVDYILVSAGGKKEIHFSFGDILMEISELTDRQYDTGCKKS